MSNFLPPQSGAMAAASRFVDYMSTDRVAVVLVAVLVTLVVCWRKATRLSVKYIPGPKAPWLYGKFWPSSDMQELLSDPVV